MSIETTLERIAVALEKLANAPTTQTPATSAPEPTPAPPSGPSGPAAVPMGGPPVGGPPTVTPPQVAPGAGVPMPTTGPASGAPAATAQATSPPAPAPQVQGVPTLDDIKALANDFHRAHPERAAEFVAVLAEKGAQKLSELPPASYPEVHGILKQMMGQG